MSSHFNISSIQDSKVIYKPKLLLKQKSNIKNIKYNEKKVLSKYIVINYLLYPHIILILI